MNRIYQKEVETTCDYTLPDYMGDLKKLLSVSARPIPSGRFASDDSVEYSGVIEYSALYADSEGKLTSIIASSDYDVSFPIKDGYKDSGATAKVASVSTRVSGPRKISFRAQVSMAADLVYEDDTALTGSGAERDDLEALSLSVAREEAIFVSLPEREYAEEATRLDGVYADDVEIIATSGAVRIIESVVEEGAVVVKGELIITAIIRTHEQPPFAIRKIVPFEERITSEDVTPTMTAVSRAYLSSVRAAVSEDGENAVITVNAISDLSATLYKNETVSIVRDAYLRNSGFDVKYDTRVFSERIFTVSHEDKVAHVVERRDFGLEGVRDILKMSAEANVSDKTVEDEGFRIRGNLAVSGVACEINADSSISYIPIRINVPMDMLVKCSCHFDESCEVDAQVAPYDVEFSLDAEHLRISVLLYVNLAVRRSRELKCAVECNSVVGEEVEKRRSEIIVYYPEPEETLFDIAKAYRTTVAKIALDNSLSDSVASSADGQVSSLGVKSVIIT